MLPEHDIDYLVALGTKYSVVSEGGMLCVVISDFLLPAGFEVGVADLMLRLAPGYPDVAPDMWWFHPAVKRIDGVEIPATQSLETYLSRTWQRWSRHLVPGQWKPGVDSIESYLALVRRELLAARPAAAA